MSLSISRSANLGKVVARNEEEIVSVRRKGNLQGVDSLQPTAAVEAVAVLLFRFKRGPQYILAGEWESLANSLDSAVLVEERTPGSGFL